jgi:ankyrin repeat protein
MSCLHFAALNSRAENVKLIIENNILSIKYRDKKNKTAFAYACEIGDIETIKSFLDFS